MKAYYPRLAILCSLISSHSMAAAMDQSGQSVLPFLEPGHYFEATITAADPEISGHTLDSRPDLATPNSDDHSTDNIAKNFQYYSAALKLQLSPQLSFGLLYDQPFGSDLQYPVKSNASFSDPLLSQQGTHVEVDTQNLSVIFGYQPIKNFNLYAGPAYQTVKGDVSLRGLVYAEFDGYNGKFAEDGALGWIAGFAYQIPHLALKTALTYHSQIDHKIQVSEDILGTSLSLVENAKTKISTPQSVNFDFQAGVTTSTLLYSTIRWVNWKDFVIRPTQFGALSELATTTLSSGSYTAGFNLDDYHKDQWSATLGVARQWTTQWSSAFDIGWDSGTGNPASILNPTKGYWNLGLSLQFHPAPNYFITGGIKYYWLGDATAQDGTYYLPLPGASSTATVGEFNDNDAIGYGLKIGYTF
ncbi:outer membrane protein transport protein [Acinetobacter bouvetii]|uniref:Outer membrane protein transport protein (OMPP1/FadL/TodX) n=1 Tax=Acinetobacter bouvetii TaxID=202951 RepID=A0A811GA73_9GAMM|nr:outer membrane protein transport protein [Acinetobacter bouvetii]CAB1212555.1 Outer membrane protein transport protein (OMPP1/FadL/TodX) [Acinetobacter bouvetii]